MDDYKIFLAEQILTEDKLVTYRSLSRALKVHVNTAKQTQNAKKVGSIHATYLVYGTKKPESPDSHMQEDGDVEMASSMPEMGSIHEEVPVVTLSLVKEESLQDVLSGYEQVTSIHVYSIGPHPTKDMQLLSEAARQVLNLSFADESTGARKPYGGITNPYVRRRDRKSTVPKTSALPAAAAKKAEARPNTAASKPAAAIKEEAKGSKAAPPKENAASLATSKKPAPSLQRGGSSGIMQAFAKGAAAKPKPKPAPEDRAIQALSDDGEDDEDAVPQPKAAKEGDHKSRKERQDELRRMMEEDDEEAEDENEDTPMEEPEEEEEPVEEPPAPEPVKAEPAEVISTSNGDGRRRGRRRVTRKKQIMDDQGYLVTIQEQGWESFSEDEPAPAKHKTAFASAPTSQATKAKKAGPKGSQGNIMSFFAKK